MTVELCRENDRAVVSCSLIPQLAAVGANPYALRLITALLRSSSHVSSCGRMGACKRVTSAARGRLDG
jgi:hypothetical protein